MSIEQTLKLQGSCQWTRFIKEKIKMNGLCNYTKWTVPWISALQLTLYASVRSFDLKIQ